MSELAKKKCVPCSQGTPPLEGESLKNLYQQLGKEWELIEGRRIQKTFRFKDFQEALAFVNAIGIISEQEDHHPDIELSWGKVKVSLMTHKIKGLSESDFVLAAKVDELGPSSKA